MIALELTTGRRLWTSAVEVGSVRLHGPRRRSGSATVHFAALRHVGRRDGVFACVPMVHRLGQGAPDPVQRRCGRSRIRF